MEPLNLMTPAPVPARDPLGTARLAPQPGSVARRYTPEDIQRNHDAKRKKYAAIRRDAENGMSELHRRAFYGYATALLSLHQPR
jgi:hypothetical protein